jgi:hypothetical protein
MLSGAQCDNDSNVAHHHLRVAEAVAALLKYAPADPLLKDPIITNLLKGDAEEKPSKSEKLLKQKALKLKYEGKDSDFDDFAHLSELSLLQVCPYLEFILRYMDMKRIGGKRWFLSLVDSSRALPDGKEAIRMT